MSEKDRAVELFKEGFNCSQSVFTAFAHRFGIDEDTAKKKVEELRKQKGK